MDKCAFYFQDDNVLAPYEWNETEAESFEFPLELSKLFNSPDIFNLFALNGETNITCVSVSPRDALPNGWKSTPVRRVLSVYARSDNKNLSNIIRSCHIAQWKRESRFCGTCGAENDFLPEHAQRLCPNCGRAEFPRICPAIIVLITDSENRILLAHNKRFRAGVYSHISGFNEAGESLEETVVREIREEINIEVNNIEYIKSQPWPFPNSLMLGFKARYLSGTIKPDGEEIEDAKFFTKDNLPELPGEGSLSRMIINNWLAGKF